MKNDRVHILQRKGHKWRKQQFGREFQKFTLMFDYTASSPFLDSREGARNNPAKAENWSEREEGAWGETSLQSLLVFFSLLQSRRTVHSRLARSRDYLERDF